MKFYDALKAYESGTDFGLENYTPRHFRNALKSKDLGILLSDEQIESIFEFMDPLSYLKNIE